MKKIKLKTTKYLEFREKYMLFDTREMAHIDCQNVPNIRQKGVNIG